MPSFRLIPLVTVNAILSPVVVGPIVTSVIFWLPSIAVSVAHEVPTAAGVLVFNA